MRREGLGLTVIAVVLSAVVGGCVTEQYSELRGAVTRGAGPTTRAGVLPLGGEFHYRDEQCADAVTGCGLGGAGGVVFFVHDRAKYEGNHFRVTTDAVSAVYFADWSLRADFGSEPWKRFVRLGEAARDGMEGVRRLSGSFDVERWESNIDFRVRLAMRSEGPEGVGVEGVLTTYERREFRPGEWVALALWSMGVGAGK